MNPGDTPDYDPRDDESASVKGGRMSFVPTNGALVIIADDKGVAKEYILRLIKESEGKGDQGAWDVVNALAAIVKEEG